jgi:hypothetical protein
VAERYCTRCQLDEASSASNSELFPSCSFVKDPPVAGAGPVLSSSAESSYVRLPPPGE